MKKVLLLCLSFTIVNFLSAQILTVESGKRAGLVSYLTTVKALA